MIPDLSALALRVAAIDQPSRPIKLYVGALLHAAEMQALPPYIVDREHRQQSTVAVARRRLARLDAEDRARVEAVEGAIK